MDLHLIATFTLRLYYLGFVDVGNEISGAVRGGGDTFSRLIAASIPASATSIPYEQVYDGGGSAHRRLPARSDDLLRPLARDGDVGNEAGTLTPTAAPRPRVA